MESSNYIQGKQFFKYSGSRNHQRLWNLYSRYSENGLNSAEPALSELAVLSWAGLETEGDSLNCCHSVLLLLLECFCCLMQYIWKLNLGNCIENCYLRNLVFLKIPKKPRPSKTRLLLSLSGPFCPLPFL